MGSASRTRPRPSIPPPSIRRNLVLTPEAIELEQQRGEAVVLPAALPLHERFGVTLLSNRRRDRLVAVVTSESGALLFATSFSSDERRVVSDLLARSTVLGGDDYALDAAGPDGAPVQMGVREFREILTELLRRAPDCMDRIVLTDQHGVPILLEGSALTAQNKRFDLGRPLEWRPILFQEQFGQAVTLYQGTWIRQGAAEVVLVSLLTPTYFEASSTADAIVERTGSPELDVMALRDQRLLQATAADPPPTDQRVAMDGLFVVPLRAALDQAPRSSSASSLRQRHSL
ncbi:MAG: IMP dehydrogenase [Polyangiaceae bacterium]